MPLSWNEIKDRAMRFSKEWQDASSEKAEAQSFWNAFFEIFGVKRRTVASFEAPVRKLSGDWGFIDCFWKGTLLVEHKSLGKDLSKAESQGIDYIQSLKSEGREDEIPQYLLVSDFARVALHDLDEGTQIEFSLPHLYKHVHAFAFIAGYQAHTFEPDDPANIKAAEKMGKLHDALADVGYTGHELERFLVRVLFCLFAEDNGLFEVNAFTQYIEQYTQPDGSDLGLHLQQWFEVLNTPLERRMRNLRDELAALPFVNGGLFEETLPIAGCDEEMRTALLSCANFRWNMISPAVFGSLFQSIMEPVERRQIGGHYTSERDILKVVRSLFLDELREEFESCKADRSTRRRSRLEEFQQKLGSLCFLDPACGCGNFLVITYRELRRLEIDVLLALHTSSEGLKQGALDVNDLSMVDVDQFYGIEISEWPARIAEVALWLMDHQMNQQLSEAFGQYYVRLPLRKSATIVCANALRIDWRDVLPPDQCSYILGNPPFVGKHLLDDGQAEDMQKVWGDVKGAKILDYVTCWYRVAAQYIAETAIRVGFVSTNSICQGEQPNVFWPVLFQKHSIKIHFGHRTFKWQSEARGAAHVHVIIVGFGSMDTATKLIFDYDQESVVVSEAGNISPYLTEGPDDCVHPASKPLCEVPRLSFGNKATDGGNLIFDSAERDKIIGAYPDAAPLIRPYLSASDMIRREPRYCFWLVGVPPAVVRQIPVLLKRIEAVRDFRSASKKRQTREMAATPTVFAEIRQPTENFLAIPKTTSERRKYIPIEYFPFNVVVASELYHCEGAMMWHFGVVTSTMHMAWMRQICGRLKSDYRYSNTLVYNTFPWPEKVSDGQRAKVEVCAQAVLDARENYPDSTLADLYDRLAMPADLVKAHTDLDRAVERCYRRAAFHSDRERVEHLFAMYERLTAPLTAD